VVKTAEMTREAGTFPASFGYGERKLLPVPAFFGNQAQRTGEWNSILRTGPARFSMRDGRPGTKSESEGV